MNGKKSNRYQENANDVPKSEDKDSIKLTVNRMEDFQHRPEKQQSKSVEQLYLLKKIQDKANPNLLSTGNLFKNLKNPQMELNRQSPIQNRHRAEPLTYKDNRIEHFDMEQFSDKNKRPRMAVISYKHSQNNKTPSWILNRKKSRQSDLHSIDPHSKSNEKQKHPSPLKFFHTNQSKQNKNKSKQSAHNSSKKPVSKASPNIYEKKLNTLNNYSFKDTNHTFITNMNQSSKFSLISNKLEKMTELQLANLRLEEELKDLKFKYENLEEDNTLLKIRMKTIESELELCQKKLKENIFKEEYYRETEQLLRQKIEELEKKLLAVISKQSQKHKKNTLDHKTSYPFSYFFTADKEILQKKNEEIENLNAIINKLRNRVKEINHELSQEKIRNITTLRNVEQKYQVDCAERELEIRKLNERLEYNSETLLMSNNLGHFNSSLNKDHLKQSTRNLINK